MSKSESLLNKVAEAKTTVPQILKRDQVDSIKKSLKRLDSISRLVKEGENDAGDLYALWIEARSLAMSLQKYETVGKLIKNDFAEQIK